MDTSLYLVWTWDGFNDSCPHLQIVFTVEEDAVVYADNSWLPHNGIVYVTKEEIGVCCPSRACYPNYVYKREHYDPQEALWEEARWFYSPNVSKEQFIRLVIKNYSPMCIDVDWDRLYDRAVEYYE